MKKTILHTAGMVLLIPIMLTGCAKPSMQSNTLTASSNPYACGSGTAETIAINSDVMWGMGKTFDEITERYGDVANGDYYAYSFKNGYGIYMWNVYVDVTPPERDDNISRARKSGGCRSIAGISAGDLLIGDLSTVNMDNLASKCGFETVPLDPMYNNYSPQDYYKFAYYTHPSYKNIMFVLCYKKSGFDKDAMFRVHYETGV